METHLHLELENLKVKLLKMYALTERALDKAIRALIDRDDELADQVLQEDKIINQIEVDIEEDILNVLARWQPVARDLRFISGCTKIANELERIGDQATNVAERAVMLNRKARLNLMNSIEDLSNVVGDMFRKSMTALSELDCDMAREVCCLDSKADELNVTIIKSLIDYMTNESIIVERAVHTIIVVNSLERVGDLSTNIAEYVFFIVKGINVKHSNQFDDRCSQEEE